MAEFTGITAAAAQAIFDQTVVSGYVNGGSGHLILVTHDGTELDAGDFTTIVSDLLTTQVAAGVASALPDSVAGYNEELGNLTGAIDTELGNLDTDNILNAFLEGTLIGNVTLNSADLPSGCRPNTQFAFKMVQDATGGRTLTLTGFKKSQGVLQLTTTANAIDILMFLYDGTNWYVGVMGVDFK